MPTCCWGLPKPKYEPFITHNRGTLMHLFPQSGSGLCSFTEACVPFLLSQTWYQTLKASYTASHLARFPTACLTWSRWSWRSSGRMRRFCDRVVGWVETARRRNWWRWSLKPPGRWWRWGRWLWRRYEPQPDTPTHTAAESPSRTAETTSNRSAEPRTESRSATSRLRHRILSTMNLV